MSEPAVAVRPARADDADAVLRWRNDPLTRAMSRTPDAVGPEAHAAFWERVLTDPELKFLIGEIDGRPFGVSAFEKVDGEWEASLHIDPAQRGVGLAAPLIRAGIRAAFDHRAPLLRAEIKEDNAASLRVFEANGFTRNDRRDDLLIYCRPPD